MRVTRQRALRACGSIAVVLILVPLYQVPHIPSEAFLSTSSGGSTLTWSDPYKIVQHAIPGNNTNPWGITADGQGNVWFVEQGTNQLGEYNPTTGAFSQYSIPSPHSAPSSVAVDSAGNVWFSELTAGKLGELPAGGNQVIEHEVPTLKVNLLGTTQPVDCGPGAVLPDPSGSVWVACLFSGQIDEYNPTKSTFAAFDLPVFNSAPAGMLLDGRGNLWFTAADAQMLGKAVVSELKNGTSEGISEFPPINSTYLFSFRHATSFLNTSTVIRSSLPTPSGIAIDASGRLWVTEHVDSSFDSYDPATSSLVKYWTSQTDGAYGYAVSFPNGISVDSKGAVWIGEHYGNKIAYLLPSSEIMTEYPVPCCALAPAGVYSVALDRNGSLWFVEIDGNAIGQVVKTPVTFSLTLALPQTAIEIGSGGSLTMPLNYSAPAADGPVTLSLALSGISGTGALENSSANFSPSNITLADGRTGTSDMTLALGGLHPGVYYLTLTARASPRGVLYSAILKLTVSPGPPLPILYAIPAAAVLAAAAAFVAWRLARRSRPRVKSRVSSFWRTPDAERGPGLLRQLPAP